MEKIEEVEVDIDWSQFAPTEGQMQIALQNCQLIYDPDKKMEKKLLYEFMDNGSLQYGRITMMSFIINTVEKIMASMLGEGADVKEEGQKLTWMCCEYFQCQNYFEEHKIFSARIFELICSPVPLYVNAGFVQVWCDILERSLDFCECREECKKNNFDPFSFPNNLLVSDLIQCT